MGIFTADSPDASGAFNPKKSFQLTFMSRLNRFAQPHRLDRILKRAPRLRIVFYARHEMPGLVKVGTADRFQI